MPAVESDTIRRIGSPSPFTERQDLRWQINRVGGRHISGQTFEGIRKVRLTEETVEKLLNGRSETTNMVGGNGVIFWGNNEWESWIGVKAGKEKISFVLKKGEDPQGYHSISGEPEDNWIANPEEIITLVKYRDELLGIS